MTVYAESSAVVAWLLDEPAGSAVLAVLGNTDLVVTSDLTLIECDRVLHRVARLAGITPEALLSRSAAAFATWSVLPISGPVVDRARLPFPDDRIRSLDAIHLASALAARATLGDVEVLSLDARVRENATALGFRVLPI